MTKAELIENVYEKVGFSKKDSSDLVELIFNVMKEALEKSEKIKISGFGNFIVRQKRARVGRNPQTGAEIQIPATKTPGFTAGKSLKRLVK